jgi:hypothetical protein
MQVALLHRGLQATLLLLLAPTALSFAVSLSKLVVLDGFTSDQGATDIWHESLSHAAHQEQQLQYTVHVHPRTAPEERVDRIGDSQAVLTSKVVIDEQIVS